MPNAIVIVVDIMVVVIVITITLIGIAIISRIDIIDMDITHNGTTINIIGIITLNIIIIHSFAIIIIRLITHIIHIIGNVLEGVIGASVIERIGAFTAVTQDIIIVTITTDIKLVIK